MKHPETNTPKRGAAAPTNSRARRRRARRSITAMSHDERAAFVEELALRAYPSFIFFLLALISGAVVAAGYLLDSPAILLLGLVLSPLMTPWTGVTLSIATGSARYFLQTVAALGIGGLFYLATGALAGLAARIWLPLPFNQAYYHSHLWWPDLLVLAVGAVLLNVSFVRSEERPALPSLIVAYGLYLPLAAAGLGLGSGVSGLWPDGLLVAAVYFGWATLWGAVALFALRFRPLSFLGFTFGSSMLLLVVVLLLALSGLTPMLAAHLGLPVPATSSPSPSVAATDLPVSPTVALSLPLTPEMTPTPTLVAAATPTPTLVTLPPTATATATPTPEPTPIFARVGVKGYQGTIVRDSPNGHVIITLMNGYLVTVYPEQEIVDGVVWVHINATLSDGRLIDGWVMQTALVTATPSSDW